MNPFSSHQAHASWKGGYSSGSPIRGTDVRSWRKPRPDMPRGASHWRYSSGRGWGYFIRRLIALGMLVLTIFLIVFLLSLPGCTETKLIISSASYSVDVPGCAPIQVFAKEDGDRLEGLKNLRESDFEVSRSSTKDQLKKEIASMSKEASCLIYISHFVRRGGDSKEVFFVVEDGAKGVEDASKTGLNPDGNLDGKNSFTLEELKDWLQKCKATRRLLIVDTNRTAPLLRFGQLRSVEAGIHEALKQLSLDDPKLLIISSCSSGEQSWCSAEGFNALAETGETKGRLSDIKSGSGSGFVYFLSEALRGRADAAEGIGDQDAKVEARELFSYVATRTNQWATATRDLKGQHPVLFYGGRSTEDKPSQEKKSTDGRSAPVWNQCPDGVPDFVIVQLQSVGYVQPCISSPLTKEKSRPQSENKSGNKTEQVNEKASRPEAEKPSVPAVTNTDVENSLDKLLKRLDELENAKEQTCLQDPLSWIRFKCHLRSAESWLLLGQPSKATGHVKSAERYFNFSDPDKPAVEKPLTESDVLERLLEWNQKYLVWSDQSSNESTIERAKSLREKAEKPYSEDLLIAIPWVEASRLHDAKGGG